MNQKKGHTLKDAAPKKSPLHNTEARAQQQRMLEALREFGFVTTFFARDELNIQAPAARVLELRNQGHKIETLRVTLNDRNGYRHDGVAKYLLIAERGGDL